MQSGIERPPIWYVTSGAPSLRNRNRPEIFVLLCKKKPYPLWFSIRRKSYPVKCENSLNLTLPTIMLPNTSSSSDDITTRPWVREIITGSSNDTKKKSWSIYLSIPGKLSCFFLLGLWTSNVQDQKGNESKQRDKRKSSSRFSSSRLVLTYHEVWGYFNTARDEFSTGWKFVRSGVPFTRNYLSRTENLDI